MERRSAGRAFSPWPPIPAGCSSCTSATSPKLVEIRTAEGGEVEVIDVWSSPSIKNSYTPPVYADGHFYGYSNRFLTCVDAATGEAVWRSREPGDGFLTVFGESARDCDEERDTSPRRYQP